MQEQKVVTHVQPTSVTQVEPTTVAPTTVSIPEGEKIGVQREREGGDRGLPGQE